MTVSRFVLRWDARSGTSRINYRTGLSSRERQAHFSSQGRQKNEVVNHTKGKTDKRDGGEGREVGGGGNWEREGRRGSATDKNYIRLG